MACEAEGVVRQDMATSPQSLEQADGMKHSGIANTNQQRSQCCCTYITTTITDTNVQNHVQGALMIPETYCKQGRARFSELS